MKTILKYFQTIVLILPFGAFAQEIDVTLSMQQFYSHQIFYSLANGEVANVDNNNWDIAFSMYGQGAAGSAVLLNEATATVLETPFDTSQWATLDTIGSASWMPALNSDTSWTNGAFNRKRGAESSFDMGWGTLDATNNFWTFGDSLYVVITANGAWKKLWIESLKTGVWNFRYADLDGSNEWSVEILKSDFPNRNFIYYSLDTEQWIDREPDNTTWDISFFKHRDYLPMAEVEVSVTGAFNNRDIWSVKANVAGLAEALEVTQPQTEFTQNVVNIGREWKDYDSGSGWTVFDSIAYFIYDQDSTAFYKIVFTEFGGMATGEFTFTQISLGNVSVQENTGADVHMAVYPNPATDNFTLLLDNSEPQNFTVQLIDLQGRTVLNESWSVGVGVHQRGFVTDGLLSGMYLLQLEGNGLRASTKLLVN